MVPELRGHGESPSPAGPWSIDDFASDVARLVAGEGGGAVMLGIGLGGATALALALGHPGLVAGLVLSGIGPRGEDPDGRDRWMLIARALRERNRDEGQALAAEAMATRPDWRGALAQVDAPVAIVAGENDKAVPPNDQRELAIWLRAPGGRRSPPLTHRRPRHRCCPLDLGVLFNVGVPICGGAGVEFIGRRKRAVGDVGKRTDDGDRQGVAHCHLNGRAVGVLQAHGPMGNNLAIVLHVRWSDGGAHKALDVHTKEH